MRAQDDPLFFSSGLRAASAPNRNKKRDWWGGSLPRAAASAALPWANISLPLRGAGEVNQCAPGNGEIVLLLQIGHTPPAMHPHDKSIPARIRKRGLLKALGGLGGLVSIYLLLRLGLMELLVRLLNAPTGSLSGQVVGPLAGILSVPFVFFCIGVLEATTGRPFRRVSSAWNQIN